MSQKAFSLTAGIIFGLIALGHLLRLVLQPLVMIGGWMPPLGGSAVALLLFAFLAYQGFRLSRQG
jgi:hypothetical protein